MNDLPIGTVTTPNGLYSGLWALPRPLTRHWGSGAILKRISQVWGLPSVTFGKQDQVDGIAIDRDEAQCPTVVADWSALPFVGSAFNSGYWDPPYLGKIGKDCDVHYSRLDNCLREITRVCGQRIFILSPLIYPCPRGWKRSAVIAITFGPNKVIRSLQGFVRNGHIETTHTSRS